MRLRIEARFLADLTQAGSLEAIDLFPASELRSRRVAATYLRSSSRWFRLYAQRQPCRPSSTNNSGCPKCGSIGSLPSRTGIALTGTVVVLLQCGHSASKDVMTERGQDSCVWEG